MKPLTNQEYKQIIMDANLTVNSLVKIIDLVNASANESANSVVPVKDLYEEYRMNAQYRLLVYRSVAYVLGALIIVSNLSVVVSSGLILRKGQKKSTYLLLGNVSLADTIVGVAIVHGISSQYTLTSNAMCVFQMGMLVCTAMVSIFSVALIAIDRYIYILHGLYYQRWFKTTRVRIGILFIWLISITLGFMPATGWVNHELNLTRCYYLSLFPGSLVLLNSVLSIVPIVVVAVLYAIILFKAIKTVKTINNTVKVKTETATYDQPKLRMHRRTLNVKSLHMDTEKPDLYMKRSASFNFGTPCKPEFQFRSKSIENLCDSNRTNLGSNEKRNTFQFDSKFSICTVETTASVGSLPVDNIIRPQQLVNSTNKAVICRKIREPKKWRAIKVVMLTSGSFIFTWLPFFVVAIFFVFCEDKLTNPKCIHLRALLGGPLAILAFVNSMLNPLIYAWWHKGFQKSVRDYYRQCVNKVICHVVR